METRDFTAAERAVDFDALLEVVARFASCAPGGDAVRASRPLTDAEALARLRARVAAAVAAEARGMPGLAGIEDERPLLETLRVPFTRLDGPDFMRVAAGLTRLDGLRGALMPAPAPLGDEARAAFDPAPLAAAVERTLDGEGTVRDDASPELRRLRRARKKIAGEIAAKLSGELKKHRDDLMESLLVERNGRLVMPVKAHRRRAVAGLTHGLSGSGQTVFIEPQAAVELNNEAEALHADELIEIRRLLTALGDAFRAVLDPLAALYESAFGWDALLARARFARACDATLAPVATAQSGPVVISGGRHPLLDPRLKSARESAGLERNTPGKVIPISLEIKPERPVLLISGPNAGGKTAALKLLGLFSLMHQCAIPLPAEAATKLPVFVRFHCDIGEDQSLLTSLSTFSARMTRLAATLSDLAGPALVLLDELGTGTDPDEGTALAKAALEKLLEAAAFTAASTHFDELKAFALSHPKMRCAAALFDEETLRPLYKLDLDHPGRSYGLAVAARAGVPEPVVGRARDLLGPEHRALADLLKGLEAKIAEAEAEKARLIADAAHQKTEAAGRHAALEQSFAQLRAQYDRLLDEALAQSKSGETKKKIAAGKSSLAAKAREAGLAAAPAPVRDFKPGDRVRDRRFGVEGVVISASQKKVIVRTGSMKMDGAPADLVFLDSGPVPSEPPRGFAVSAAPAAKPGLAREINLLGKYVDDGLAELETFIAAALRGGWRQVRVVHGHGTGRLKRAVRDWLRKAPGVAGFDSAPPNEGGDGATIVTLDL